jgi:hypothetical protein
MFYTSDGKKNVSSFLDKQTPRFTSRVSQVPSFYEEWMRKSQRKR